MLLNESKNSAKILRLLTTNIAQLVLLLGMASILISVLSTGVYQEFFNKMGTILIPTGLVSFLFNHMLRMTFLEEMHNQIIDAIQDIYPNVKELKKSGLQKVY